IGVKQNQVGELGYQYIMTGDPKYLDAINKVGMPTEADTFISEGRVESAIRSAAKMLPMMADTAVDSTGAGLTMGMAFGGTAAILGQLGPQAALPEEIATVPAATLAGFTIGATAKAFESSLRKEAGLALSEIINFKDKDGRQIDPNIARAASFGIGAINGAIEVAQIGKLLKTVPGLDKLFSKAVLETVASKTVKQKLLGLSTAYAGTVGTETGQEVAQESTNIVFEELAKKVSNAVKGTDIQPSTVSDIIGRLQATAVEAAQGFAVMAAPGTAVKAGMATVPQSQKKPAPVPATPQAGLAGIAKVESGGDYTAQHAKTGAYGKYQIMPSNWGPWAKEAGLEADAPMTPENQETVANFKWNQYMERFGDDQLAATAWFAGPGTAQRLMNGDMTVLEKKDANGTTVAQYIQKTTGREFGIEGQARQAEAQAMDIDTAITSMIESEDDIEQQANAFFEGVVTDTPQAQENVQGKQPWEMTREEFEASPIKGYQIKKLSGEDIARAESDGTISLDPDNFFSQGEWARKEVISHENAHLLEAKISPEYKAKLFDNPDVMNYRGRNINEKLANMITDGKVPSEVLKDYPDLVAHESRTVIDQVKAINDRIGEKGSIDLTPIVDLGRSVYQQGARTYEQFSARAKELLADVWDKVKDLVRQAWDVISNESGKISFDKKDKSGKIKDAVKQTPSETGPVTTGSVQSQSEKEFADSVRQTENQAVTELKSLLAKAEKALASAQKKNKTTAIKRAQEKVQSVKARIREITGQTKGPKTVTEYDALKASFVKAAQAARVAYRAGNKEGVEKAKAQMKEAYAKAQEKRQAKEQRAKDLKAIKKLSQMKGSIAVDYQKKIRDLMEGIDFKNITPAKWEQLKALQDFIESEGVPLGINPKRLDELKRLTAIPLKSLDNEQIAMLRKQLEELTALGKLKASLKYKYNERKRAELEKKILGTTRNLDPSVQFEKGELRRRDKMKVASVAMYLNTMHTPRVADLADGYNDYKGEQARLIKSAGEAEARAVANATKRQQGWLDFLRENKIELPTEGSESDIRMNIVIRMLEGATKPAEMLMKEYGVSEVPTLTDEENKIIEYIRQDMDRQKGKLAATWEEINEEIFPE
ncbi:MAG: transglycosylase SLT domain-containing protein, partial [Candidatus Omnitrophota bacterium]